MKRKLLEHKKLMRAGAGILAGIVVASGAGGYYAYAQKEAVKQEEQKAAKQEKKDEEENLLDQVLKKQADRDSTDVQKEETVYVVSDPQGTAKDVIVSDWLKNPKNEKTLKDASDLTDIENVKGNETYTADSDGNLTWQADGKDIYYQGKTDKELPVEMKVTYYLDGKKIESKDLAGKSGKVKIHMDYTNHEKAKKNGIYVPFTVISGMILDDNFSNIEVTNGKVLSDGKKNMVVGFAFPGMKESLDLESTDLKDDLEIPEYVEVTADVEDFSLDMTMTVMMSDILQELNIDQDLDLGEIEDALDELNDASKQLVDGSKDLSKGAGTLSSGIKDYTDGASSLKKGVNDYTDGVGTLKKGVTAYTDGVASLKKGITQYTDGVAKVADGTQKLKDSSGTLKDGIQELVSGASQVQTYFEGDSGLVSGSAAISNGVSKLDAALRAGVTSDEKKQAAKAVDQMFDKNGKTYQGIKSQAADQYKSAMKNSDALKSGVADGVSQAMYGAYYNSFMQLNKKALLQAGVSEAEIEKQAKSFAEQMLAASSDAISEASGQLVSGIADGSSDLVGSSVAEACKSAAQTGVESGIASTKESIADQIEAGGDAGLVGGSKALKKGVSKLYKEGIKPLNQGMQTLNSNVPELMSGIKTLNDGAATLNKKSSDLKKGANTLNSKGKDLNDGAMKLIKAGTALKDGAAQLTDNNEKLNSGASDLKAGAEKLSDGMVQFDRDGIQKLKKAYDGDVKKLANRIDDVLDAGKEYHTFSKLSKGTTGNVKFIIRTEEIE